MIPNSIRKIAPPDEQSGQSKTAQGYESASPGYGEPSPGSVQTETLRQTGQTATETLEQAKQKGAELTRTAQERARAIAESRKNEVAGILCDVSAALHQTAQQLQQQQHDVVGSYTDTAARRLDQFCDTLRQKDVGYFVHQVEDFARRRPRLFLGGALVAGIACARFLKSSRAGEKTISPGEAI